MVILTCLYVSACENQLEIMKKQLFEMETESKLRELPYFIIKEIEFRIEKPHLFWSQPDDEIKYFSRFFVKYDIINLSSYPAINLVAKVKIISKHYGELLSSDEGLEFLLSGDAKELSYMFPENTINVLNEIRNNDITDIPVIIIDVYYQNLFGAYLHYEKKYKIYCSINNKNMLTQIHTSISSFHTKYLVEFKTIIDEKNLEYKRILFDNLKKRIENEESELKEIMLDVESDSHRIIFESIPKDDYFKIIKKSFFGRKLNYGFKNFDCKH